MTVRKKSENKEVITELLNQNAKLHDMCVKYMSIITELITNFQSRNERLEKLVNELQKKGLGK